MTPAQQKWDTAYEWKAVTLLGLGFGLVGLDRWIIAPLFPFMMKDLGLGYQELGNIAGVLGLAWGFFAIISGGFGDKIGHRKILIPALVLFSLLSGVSGFATGALSLILIRAMMGITEGSFCPTSFAATNEASAPSRRGFNQGLQQCTFALFGLGFAPISHCDAVAACGAILAIRFHCGGGARADSGDLSVLCPARAETPDPCRGRH